MKVKRLKTDGTYTTIAKPLDPNKETIEQKAKRLEVEKEALKTQLDSLGNQFIQEKFNSMMKDSKLDKLNDIVTDLQDTVSQLKGGE